MNEDNFDYATKGGVNVVDYNMQKDRTNVD